MQIGRWRQRATYGSRSCLVLLLAYALLQVGIPAALGTGPQPMSSGSSILPAIPKHEQIRVAMCVVGELGQTEFRSKIDNLILPNKRNADMHMFLVLQTRESNARCKVVPASLKDAVAKFSKHVPTTVTEYKYEPYYVDIDKWPGFPEIRDEKKRILQNHMNQYRSWQICAKMIAKQELKTRMKYHAVLRIQDNALVLQPLNILDRLQLLSQQVRSPTAPSMYGHGRLGLMDLPVITKACSSWSGVNDEAMLIPRMHMDAALSGMAEEFYLVNVNETWPMSIENSETYMKMILEKMEVPIFVEQDPQNFPITEGRCEDGGSFCVVDQSKDCLPQKSSFPVEGCQNSNFGNGRDYKREREEAARKAEQIESWAKGADVVGNSRQWSMFG